MKQIYMEPTIGLMMKKWLKATNEMVAVNEVVETPSGLMYLVIKENKDELEKN